MTTISLETVRETAAMACLGLSDEALEAVQKDMNNLLGLLDKLDEVDVEGIMPMRHPLALVQRLRKDKVTETNRRKKLQAIAPDTQNGYYRVPLVIDDT